VNKPTVLPASRGALTFAGWKFEFSRPCKACARVLQFWRTPLRSLAPLEVVSGRTDDEWLLDTHFKTCPHSAEFSRKKPAAEKKPAPTATQCELFGGKKA
jgi:hypothetical protein